MLPVLLAAELKDAARESARGAEYANNFNVCIDKTQNTYTIMPLEDFRNFPVTSQKTKNHARVILCSICKDSSANGRFLGSVDDGGQKNEN